MPSRSLRQGRYVRDRREAQRAAPSGANGAAGAENIGFALSARVKKGQLHGDNFARRRLNGERSYRQGFRLE